MARSCRASVAGQRIVRVGRRAKYLLLELESGTLLLHLGMSGNLRVVPAEHAAPHRTTISTWCSTPVSHCASTIRAVSAACSTPAAIRAEHPLLRRLAPEPFAAAFDADYLWRVTRRRRVAIKQLLMNSHLVVGVGNIYASEALFRARIRPQRQARTASRAREAARLVRAVRTVLRAGDPRRRHDAARLPEGRMARRATSASGSTCTSARGQPCRRCGTPVRARDPGAALHVLLSVLPEVARMSKPILAHLSAPMPVLGGLIRAVGPCRLETPAEDAIPSRSSRRRSRTSS